MKTRILAASLALLGVLAACPSVKIPPLPDSSDKGDASAASDDGSIAPDDSIQELPEIPDDQPDQTPPAEDLLPGEDVITPDDTSTDVPHDVPDVLDIPCIPKGCDGKTCGWDGCGGKCPCAPGTQCKGELCVAVCVPDCNGKTCGPDGCEGTCGTCTGADVCTQVLCVEGQCKSAKYPDCCTDTSQCDDLDKCTDDSCMANKCVHELAWGCCKKDGDCEAENPCVKGTCELGLCKYGPAPGQGCCATPADCDDGDPCTTDACTPAFTCQNQPVYDCCETAGDCNDMEECTLDDCEQGVCTHSPAPIPGCCSDPADCSDPDPCTLDLCDPTHHCHHISMECCVPGATCDDKDKCTIDECLDGTCHHKQVGTPACCGKNVFSVGFEPGLPFGFTLSDPAGGVGWWVVDNGKSSTGTGSLYYGNPDTKNYDNGLANGGTAVSKVLAIPKAAGASLKFHVYVDTEPGADYDRFTVSWFDLDGFDLPLWQKDKTVQVVQKKFMSFVVNLNALAGRTGQITFMFESVDQVNNWGEGVYIDDVALLSTCTAVTCTSAEACGDGMPWSVEGCTSGQCVYDLK